MGRPPQLHFVVALAGAGFLEDEDGQEPPTTGTYQLFYVTSALPP